MPNKFKVIYSVGLLNVHIGEAWGNSLFWHVAKVLKNTGCTLDDLDRLEMDVYEFLSKYRIDDE